MPNLRTLCMVLLALPVLGVADRPGPGSGRAAPVPPQSVDGIIAQLGQSNLTDQQQAALLAKLDCNNPRAIATLIMYLEFCPHTPGWESGSLDRRLGRTVRRSPAVAALFRIGAPAAPALVDEYVFFYENTSLEARKGRVTEIYLDHDWKPLAVQNPWSRLLVLRQVLRQKPDVAKAGIAHALKRMAEEPRDDRVRRACRELIEELVREFPPEERENLAPPTAFLK
jgi:hypothetical protein